MVEDTEFENFLAYAKKKRWKKDGDVYIIPRRTTLDFIGPVDCAPHLGLFEINGDGVYVSVDCGTAMFHTITAASSTHTLIDTLIIKSPEVNYDERENIQVIYRTND